MVILIIIAVLILLLAIALAVVCGYAFKMSFLADFNFSKSKARYTNKEKLKIMEQVYCAMEEVNAIPAEQVSITSFDGLKLNARYYKGQGRATLLLVHGYRSKSEYDFCMTLPMLKEQGYDILLIDHRAQNGSEGKYSTFGVLERLDIKAWCSYLVKEKQAKSIVLYGMSMGGAAAMMAANTGLDVAVKGIISDSAFTAPWDIIAKRAKNMGMPCVGFTLSVMNLLYCKPKGRFDLFSVSVPECLAKCTLPLLIIHGKKDDFVPYQASVTNFEACAGEKKLLLVEGADHTLSYLTDTPAVKAEMLGFIESVIK